MDFTHVHTDFKSSSTLDHFILNRRLIDAFVDCGVMHLGDNPSRHSPNMLKLNLGKIPVGKQRLKSELKASLVQERSA